MKAVRLNELGGPEKLHVEEIPDPVPGPGQICVKLKRAAFNRRDVFITKNLYPGVALPATLGSDGTGEVAALGAGVAGPALGTPVVIDPEIGWDDTLGHAYAGGGSVLGMPVDGTFAEYIVVPAENVYPKPAGLDDDEAAAIPLAGLTAYRAAFTRGRLSKDDVVLITGVGGGVQSFVLLYAKRAGARTIVTSGSDEKLARAKALGADVAINYKSDPDWHKTARKASDGGPCSRSTRPAARRSPSVSTSRARSAASSATAARPEIPRSGPSRSSGTARRARLVDGQSLRFQGHARALRERAAPRRRPRLPAGRSRGRRAAPLAERAVRQGRAGDQLTARLRPAPAAGAGGIGFSRRGAAFLEART